MRHPLKASVAIAGALALVLAGCGGDDEVASEPSATETTHMETEGTTTEHEEGTFAFGEPAEESEADRTVEIEANDQPAFDPDSIEVTAGETVTFEITNTGQAVHEFVIGDKMTQDEHETEMEEMSDGMMGADPNAVDVQPGETARLTWHFTESGEVLYGCHEPGHYAGGMVGTITVS